VTVPNVDFGQTRIQKQQRARSGKCQSGYLPDERLSAADSCLGVSSALLLLLFIKLRGAAGP